MEKDEQIVGLGYEFFKRTKERKVDYAYNLFSNQDKPDFERDLIESCLGTLTSDGLNLSEDRVREIVREELLEFKLQYLRADTLFQRILQEIRREKSGKSSRKR